MPWMPWKECSVKDERLQSVTYMITHVPRAGPSKSGAPKGTTLELFLTNSSQGCQWQSFLLGDT